jgi:MSHA biogenesis protein MshP
VRAGRISGARVGPRAAGGFALIAAIFVILVLAALAMFAVRIGATQQQTADYALLNARAQLAADSGIEYGINQALVHGSCPGPATTLNPGAAGLKGFTVRVTCTVTGHQIGAAPPTTYHAYALTSVAQLGTYGTSGYVARTATRMVNDAP